MNIDSLSHVFLEKDLSQKQYPMSFRYYDFIINFVEENFPSNRRDYFKTITYIASEHHISNHNNNIIKKLGLFNETNQQDFTLRELPQKDQTTELKFDFNNSLHAMGLQKSDYICIDHELMNKHKFQITPGDQVQGKFKMEVINQYGKAA